MQLERGVVPFYTWFVIPPSLLGLAIILAVIRAKQDDLPDIVRALMRFRGDDDDENPPPALPPP